MLPDVSKLWNGSQPSQEFIRAIFPLLSSACRECVQKGVDDWVVFVVDDEEGSSVLAQVFLIERSVLMASEDMEIIRDSISYPPEDGTVYIVFGLEDHLALTTSEIRHYFSNVGDA